MSSILQEANRLDTEIHHDRDKLSIARWPRGGLSVREKWALRRELYAAQKLIARGLLIVVVHSRSRRGIEVSAPGASDCGQRITQVAEAKTKEE